MTRSLSRAGQPTQAAILLLAFTIFGIYLLSSSWRFPIGEDGRATLATSRSLLTRRTLAIDAAFASDEGYGPRAKIGVDGRAYAKAGLGLPIAELPFVATGLLISKLAGLPEAHTLASVLSLLNPLVSASTAIVVYELCQTVGCSPVAALLTAIAYAFATFAWVYAGVDGTEPLQALCLAVSLLLLIRYRSERHARLLSGSSVALACAIVTKPANAVLVPALGLYALSAVRARRLSWRETVPVLMRFAVPLALCVLFLSWLNWFRFGSVLETGYEPHAFMNRFLGGIYGLVFSFNKGILFYAPPLVLAPVGLWIMRRSQRGEAMLIALASVTYICLFAKFYNWGGGWSWGPRYLMPIVPLLMMPVARAAATARVWRYAGAGLFIAGLLLNGVGVLVDGDAYHTAIMNVDLTDRTGFVQVGSVVDPSRMVNMPVPPDYVLPEFSEIVGKLWLARVAWDACACDEDTAKCGCRTSQLEKNGQFSSPPWMRHYPQIHPLPPYGSRLINPWIANWIHRSFIGNTPHPTMPVSRARASSSDVAARFMGRMHSQHFGQFSPTV
jgi:Dolichyl-phosphate-mannose-protein mannosyltransferase